jgi:hypothetical protein
VAAVLLLAGCPAITDTPDNPDDTDSGVLPVVAADPDNASDSTLVPNSKDLSGLGLSNPGVIVFTVERLLR